MASLAINAISTTVLIYFNYKKEESQFETRLTEIKSSHIISLGNALWQFDNKQITVQGEGISSLYYIGYVRIANNDATLYEKGKNKSSEQSKHYFIPITHEKEIVGELEIGFARDSILSSIIDSAQQIIAMQLLSGILLALLLLWRVYSIVTRHLIDLKRQLRKNDKSCTHQQLTLDRPPFKDELSAVVNSFNQLTADINKELTNKEVAQQQLAETNSQLEQRVEERTQSLQTAVNELNSTLENLQSTQSQLIESEKLSSLGSMVAGVAHEVNTPIGLCITTHSFIKDLFKDMQKRFETGNISKQNFTDFMTSMEECVDILSKNLQRAAKLVQSFKHVSEDQAGEALRHYNLAEYLSEIMSTLNPKLKMTQHQVEILCAEDIELTGYPGALSQIVTNLIMNSLLHGFEGIDKGTICISVEDNQDQVNITYTDNGVGLSQESQLKIFDPFYTTKRGYGGTGLGMHLVYNLVNQRLKGTIKLLPQRETETGSESATGFGGCGYIINLPKILKEEPAKDNA